MKKKGFRYFCFIVLSVIVLPLVFVFSPSMVANAEKSGDFIVETEENVITKVRGDFSEMTIENVDDAFVILDSLKDRFGFSRSRDALSFEKTIESLVGIVYHFNQIVDGIEVYGSALNLSVRENNKLSSILGKYFLDVQYDKNINFSKDDALDIVEESYDEAEVEFIETYIYDFSEGDGYVAYAFMVSSFKGSKKVFVSANTNEIKDEIATETSFSELSGTPSETTKETYQVDGESVIVDVTKYITSGGYYYALSNPTKHIFMADGKNQTSYTSKTYEFYIDNTGTKVFVDNDAIKAYEALLKCYDFYADVNSFGIAKNGITVAGSSVPVDLIAIVHYGSGYENAAYSYPNYFIFGDGNGTTTKSFVNGVDVIGHEYQHAYTMQICDFDYKGEAGALCEAFSDIFGAVIEGKGIENSGFWLMGEDVSKTGNYAFRNMSDPKKTGCTSDYATFKSLVQSCNGVYDTNKNDNGYIHTNCTLPTYATYLFYDGNPEFFTEYNILRLWYQTLVNLSGNTGATIENFCEAMMQSAEDLDYSKENKVLMERVFCQLGIPGYSGIEIWNGFSLKVFEGNGTIASPFIINNVEELASLAYFVNSGDEQYSKYLSARYKLNADIEIASSVEWVQIGTATSQFSGTFNGNSKKIIINQTVENSAFGGIFGYCDENAYVYDLYVEGTKIETSSEYAGAIAMVSSGTISSCSSDLDISGVNVGGLVGLVKSSDGEERIINSFATSTLEGEEVGGLVAHFETLKNTDLGIYDSGYIFSSYFSGKVTGKVVGGLVARANGIYFVNNIVNAQINSKNDKNSFAGGLVGVLQLEDIFSTKGVSWARNYLICNKVVVDHENSDFGFEQTKTQTGLLVGKMFGELGQGYYLFENNTLKSDGVHVPFNGEVPLSMIQESDTVISDDAVFTGVFDFDNKTYYDAENWFTIEGSTAFDLISTFKVVENSMPIFGDIEFWLNDTDLYFDGSGTEADPYRISSAQELAGLTALLSDGNYYNSYASKHYKLTADIDLSGKIWSGVGCLKYTYENNTLKNINIMAFQGVFDGDGHTILNMKSLGVNSISTNKVNPTNYAIYSFGAGLFSYTLPTTYQMGLFGSQIVSTPTIKNLTIENAEVTGSYAGSLISRAFLQVDISNVTVMNVNVSGSVVAGGLVGSIEGKSSTDIFVADLESKIDDSYVLGTVSGNIVGGAIGYFANSSSFCGSNLSVKNFLGRGRINIIGSDHDAEYDPTNGASYYRPLAGSVVGVMIAKKLTIINSICMQDIVSYVQGASMGGFVGGVGIGDSKASLTMEISIDGSKFIGDIYDVFNKDSEFCGSVIGKTHGELASSLMLKVTNTTFTNINNAEIYQNGMTNCQIQSEIQTSNDEVGVGAFAIYDDEYFANGNYFNLTYQWNKTLIGRLPFTVRFFSEGVQIGDAQHVKNGEGATAPENVVRASTAEYDFVFIGWDCDFSNITSDTRVNALWGKIKRSYQIIYRDEKGEELEILTLEYGEYINNQNVEAPEKKGNLFFKYEFKCFGERTKQVEGNSEVYAVYERKFTKLTQALIVVGLFTLFCVIVVVVNKKSRT